MPRLDRGVVNNKLVLGLILWFGCDLDGSFDEREGMMHLVEVIITLELPLLDLSLLDRSFGKQSPAEELILLIDSLKEDVSDATGALVPPVGKQSNLNVHDDNLWRQLTQTLSWIIEDDLLSLIHASVALGHKGFILFSVLNVERCIFK